MNVEVSPTSNIKGRYTWNFISRLSEKSGVVRQVTGGLRGASGSEGLICKRCSVEGIREHRGVGCRSLQADCRKGPVSRYHRPDLSTGRDLIS